MIVADTTNVNTGRQNGIVVQLQNKFTVKKLEESQYIRCQYHILDRVLRVIMDAEFGGKNILTVKIAYSHIKSVRRTGNQMLSRCVSQLSTQGKR